MSRAELFLKPADLAQLSVYTAPGASVISQTFGARWEVAKIAISLFIEIVRQNLQAAKDFSMTVVKILPSLVFNVSPKQSWNAGWEHARRATCATIGLIASLAVFARPTKAKEYYAKAYVFEPVVTEKPSLVTQLLRSPSFKPALGALGILSSALLIASLYKKDSPAVPPILPSVKAAQGYGHALLLALPTALSIGLLACYYNCRKKSKKTSLGVDDIKEGKKEVPLQPIKEEEPQTEQTTTATATTTATTLTSTTATSNPTTTTTTTSTVTNKILVKEDEKEKEKGIVEENPSQWAPPTPPPETTTTTSTTTTSTSTTAVSDPKTTTTTISTSTTAASNPTTTTTTSTSTTSSSSGPKKSPRWKPKGQKPPNAKINAIKARLEQRGGLFSS